MLMPEPREDPPFNTFADLLLAMDSIRVLCNVARNVADELRIRGDHKIGASFETALREAVDEVFGDA